MKAGNTATSNCEKDFVLSSIQSGVRLDGRKTYDYRKLKISFGESFGHCQVCLGNTRVLAQVSCEVIKPTHNRPTEGQLFFNLELSSMASPAFESGRPSDYAIEISRFIERCLKESRPIDAESLCIIVGEKVWCLRVDIQVLDDAGNILDCACVAAITALAHFRRPDVTVTGKDVVIHSLDDREPISLNVHHIPICITFGFIDSCDKPIMDPGKLEEVILDGQLIMAMNSHSEICCAKMCGVPVKFDQIMMCCNVANVKVTQITKKIQKCLENDKKKRLAPKDENARKPIGDDFEEMEIMKTVASPTKIDVTDAVREASETIKDIDALSVQISSVDMKDGHTGVVGDGGSSAWVISDDESDTKNADVIVVGDNCLKLENSKNFDYIEVDDDVSSEEEETAQVTLEDLGFKKSKPIEIDVEDDDPQNQVEEDQVMEEATTKNIEITNDINTQKQKSKKRKKGKTIIPVE